MFIIAGGVLVAMLDAGSSIWSAAFAAFVLGLGLGLSSSPTLVAVQSVVGWDRRGVVTATNLFSRSLGSAVGAAVFGAIANATLASRFASPPAEVAGQLPPSVDATSLVLGGHTDNSPVATFVRGALADATHYVFVGLAVGGGAFRGGAAAHAAEGGAAGVLTARQWLAPVQAAASRSQAAQPWTPW